ncbi:hypothetical protein VNO78_03816 [Psophocarpus tetragonolobus]|uniref:Uncharacterized protein n=1 Tax=Psophocarpus tetragonolobus TaxID=3891 RepID=A0AAN9TDZ3_PSOTE
MPIHSPTNPPESPLPPLPTLQTVDTFNNVGEKAKQGMQGAWEMTKDTTHKIKDTVVGKDDDHHHGGLKDKDEDVAVADLKSRLEKGY